MKLEIVIIYLTTGQVVFYSKHGTKSSTFQVDQIIDGEQFASSFGYSVIAVDVNGDK